jgi:glycosyltransferase involved in cell wall biosynthesis
LGFSNAKLKICTYPKKDFFLLKILTFTSLFPNNACPHHGVFVKERMVAVSRLPEFEVEVVAPVPYWPNVRLGPWWLYSQIERTEKIESLLVHHPRYFLIPKIGMVLHGWLMFVGVLPYMKALAKAKPFDVIDAHYVYPDGLAAVLLGKYFRCPVIVSARGSDVNQFASFPLIRKFLQYTLHHAMHNIAVCEALKISMVSLGIPSEKISVVPNGVDQNKFSPIEQAEARVQLGLPVSKKIVLSVGGLIPRKGFDLLIHSFSRVTTMVKNGELYLVIVGQGPELEALKQLVAKQQLAERVLFAGDIPHQDLYKWYSAADVFCLASSREGWPNVVLESLACGTPVVATSVWGTPEIISSPCLGFLAERNVEAFSCALEKGIVSSWDRAKIVQFAQKHTWEKVADSVGKVLKKAASYS